MKPLHLLITITLLVNSEAMAQVFFNSVPVDTLRYYGIAGSPYMYDNWQMARIVCRDSSVYDSVLLNFNGYEQTFEVKQPRQTVTLDDKLYDLITVYNDYGEAKEWFIRGVHYEIATKLANVIYNGKKVKLIRQYTVKLAEVTDEVPGQTLVKRSFYPVTSYFINYQSKLRQIRLSKFRLGRVLEDKEMVDNLARQYNLDLTEEADVVQLLKHFEESKFN